MFSGAIIQDGRSFVPLRSIFEQMGAEITFDMMSKVATITLSENDLSKVEVKVNFLTGKVTLNDQDVQME